MNLLEGKQIARRLRLSAGTLETLKQTGKVKDYGGKYDFDEVQRAVALVEGQRATQTELVASEVETSDPRTHALEVSQKLAERSLSHEATMFALYVKAIEQQHLDARAQQKILQDENAALRKQVAEQHEQICTLQGRYVETLQAHEEALSQAHQRKLAERMADAADRRKEQGMKMLEQAVPPLLDSIKATLEQKNLVGQLMKTFEPAQLAAMLDSGFFTPEQTGLLQKLVAASQPKPKPQSAPAATQNGAAHATHQEQAS